MVIKNYNENLTISILVKLLNFFCIAEFVNFTAYDNRELNKDNAREKYVC